MASWKIHILFGLILYFAFVLIFSPGLEMNMLALALLVFASLLPDLDHPKSVIRLVVAVLGSFFVAIFLISNVEGLLTERLVVGTAGWVITYFAIKNLPLKHRGKKSLHQWWVLIILVMALGFAFWWTKTDISLMVFVLLGYGSHLILDRIKKDL